ncbi:hypothetical protein [Vibrio sp. qd031]|uniref:hypothetical protein n=1 Tax=Vibrio sp. qd031 TaxID=1603038 RepID=UPI001180314C|nr:hypothetical protein [Vibrio sp. qd031]
MLLSDLRRAKRDDDLVSSFESVEALSWVLGSRLAAFELLKGIEYKDFEFVGSWKLRDRLKAFHASKGGA